MGVGIIGSSEPGYTSPSYLPIQGGTYLPNPISEKSCVNIGTITNLDNTGVSSASASINSGLKINSSLPSIRYLPPGIYLITEKIIIPEGICLLLDSKAILYISMQSGDAITIQNAGRICGGQSGSRSQIQLPSTSKVERVITNSSHDGTQEYAYIENILITAGEGFQASVSIIDIVSIFVNSLIQNCVINGGSSENIGLRIAGGTITGCGPISVINCWVLNCSTNILVTENNPTKGNVQVFFHRVTSEHPSSGHHNLEIVGFGGILISISGFHTESGVESATLSAGIFCNGVGQLLVDGWLALASPIANKRALHITNSGWNGIIDVRGLQNPNLINPVIIDETLEGYGLGAIDVPRYTGTLGVLPTHYGPTVIGGDLRRSSQTIAFAAELGLIDPLKGEFIDVGILTGNVTVPAPFAPQKGQQLTFFFTQDGVGGRTVTWNAAFKVNWAPNTAAGKVNTITFRYDGEHWVQIATSSI